MREIKFEYIYKRKSDGFINKLVFDLNKDMERFGKAMLDSSALYEYDLIDRRQYTGLKDKNGVDIYEGDVIRQSFEDYQVKWNEVMCCFVGYLLDGSDYEMFSYVLRSNRCEVIGNIYQNPELLEQ